MPDKYTSMTLTETKLIPVIRQFLLESAFLAVSLAMTVSCSSDKGAMWERLEYVSQCNRADTVFTEAWLPTVDSLVSFFDHHGNANERMMAHYLQGRVHHDMGETPASLQAYYDAIDYADTTKVDCDFITLRSIYGQMSRIFHQQDLPHDEIWAIRHFIDCMRRTSNMEDYVVARSQLIRPYYLLGEKDSVLQIIIDTYQSLKHLGKDQRAASILSVPIHIYIERRDLQKAKQIMDIFENESGQFDENGNIAKGREYYYYTKGLYKLAINDYQSAEQYFRKVILYGYLSEGYKGLLSVYREKQNMDSIVRFSRLYEAAQDSIHNKMQTDVIHQMSSLYNYSRSQREAEQERENTRKARIMLGVFLLITIVLMGIIGIIFLLYRRKQQKKRERICKLERELEDTKLARREVQEELKRLKANDYEGMIAEKERKEAELTREIERLQAENNIYKGKDAIKEKDCLEDFRSSKIAQLFMKRAKGKSERLMPTDAEWSMLMSQFGKDIPITLKSFAGNKPLSPLEQRICMLLFLDIPEKSISIMTDSVASTVSNAKARTNEKLFGKKTAHSLKTNLFHALKQV